MKSLVVVLLLEELEEEKQHYLGLVAAMLCPLLSINLMYLI